MLAALLTKFGGWIVAALATIAGLAGVYLKGRTAGREVERVVHVEREVERERKINEQAAEARQEVQNVEMENAGRSDAAVLDAARKWVRK